MAIYTPEIITKTYSIAAAASITDTISPDFLVTRVNITPDADVTASVTFGGKTYTASFLVPDDFGESCMADLAIAASNAGAAAENLTIEVLGYRQTRK